MADTIERAKADDPRELRKRIADLERQLRERPTPDPVEVQIPVFPDEQIDKLQLGIVEWAEQLHEAVDVADRLLDAIVTTRAVVRTDVRSPRAATKSESPPQIPRRGPATPQPPGAVTLKAGARRMLETLAAHHPMRLTKAQLSTLSKIRHTGGTWSTYYGVLKKNGLIDDAGGDIGITDAGVAQIGGSLPAPMSTDQLLDHYRSVLKAGARRMLDELLAVYPAAISRDELAERAEITQSGGTFSTYLGHLRRNGLVADDGTDVRASETLFLGGAA